jgi:carboxyl-terminal processing protease
MRGPENSKIKLKIMRKGQEKPIEVSITRARIQVRSVRSRLEGDDVGFIRVTQFSEQTTADLKKAITDLSTQPGDKLKGKRKAEEGLGPRGGDDVQAAP